MATPAAASDDTGPTQPSTQQMLDPRRLGRNNSGLNDADIDDVLVILHPTTPAATRVVEHAATATPQHVLFCSTLDSMTNSVVDIEEQETIIIDSSGRRLGTDSSAGADLALRMSSAHTLKCKEVGFVFGRNPVTSDIVFGQDSGKRISNQHFRIYLNTDGILMVQDMSTNGTVVDDILLKANPVPIRMIHSGSIIYIQHTNPAEVVKFVVRIPPRASETARARFNANLRNFITNCATAEDRPRILQRISKNHGGSTMKWDGGNNYNIIGQLGKGAFATVYRIATKMEGKILAAKELEKRRFIKNGQLDKKIDNEMRIMQGLRHPNIVEFVEHHDQGDYLYIIMEYVPHGDLQAHLHQEGPLSETAGRAVAQQILSALGYLHQARITHRDIKPDNILIAEQNPVKVKLSDFGLSKVVKHDDTFLKTFCGTLLYCAPEVFPDYGTAKGTKRRRGAKQYHSYSSSVDIWSFGGVLWYALCKEPPFKGIADATGEAMYNNIIATPLDPRPLQQAGVSDTCIDLLTRMLQTDPALRPTARECLNHPWLKEGATLPADPDLHSIVEEDESEETEQKLSQLSIGAEQEGEEEDEIPGSDEEADVLSDEELIGFIDTNRQPKRIRADPLFPRNHIRDAEAFSAHASFQSDYGIDEGESFNLTATPGRGRLFGEIGQSVLESSGINETHIRGTAPEVNSQDSSLYETESLPTHSHAAGPLEREIPFSAPPHYMENCFSSPSLLGAESMVRDLNMISEQSAGRRATTESERTHSPNGPTTPRTPEVAQHSSLDPSSKFSSMVSEATPKARPSGVSRQISLPLTASYYYNPLDPSTHNLEYASRVSGYDFVKAQKATTTASGYEDTVGASETTNSNSSMEVPSEGGAEPSASAAVPSVPAELDIRPPPRRLGKLVATNDSFVAGLTINIDRSQTSWGRLSNNTVVYENSRDTRIPKIAFVIFWYSSAGDSAETVQQLSQEGKDWTSLPGLHVGIWTCATHGISVNGKHLKQKDERGRAVYGHLHTGDIVQVYQHRRGGECLKFRCEFYLGSGKEARASGNDFTELLGSKC